MKRGIKVGIFAIIFGLLSFTLGPTKDKYYEIAKNMEIFTNLYKELNTHYVEDLDPGELMRTGIDAIMKSLDPYTVYYSESQIEGYRLDTEGRYEGIGAEIDFVDNIFTILSVSKDLPADKAELKPGDQINAINGNDTEGRTLDELRKLMSGASGTALTFTIKRTGAFESKDIEVERKQIEKPNVPYHGLLPTAEDIGYIRHSTFTAGGADNIRKAYNELKDDNENLKGLVLDLRGNGGGLLREAIAISNLFVPKGKLVVSTRGKVKDRDKNYETREAPLNTDIPIVVLINGRSASASEIVSGVLQDYDRGVLIGQRSYGKGLVQNTMDIGYNSKIKVTISKYFIPSGRCIQGVEYDEFGDPIDIPESRRAAFKTSTGRTVYDGGGVKPDIVLPEVLDIPVVKALTEKHFIFKYVNSYMDKNPTYEGAIEDFRFTDWNSFTQFLKKENFQYQTKSEELLNNLLVSANKEALDLKNDIRNLQQDIQKTKDSQIEANKSAILDLIEKEIAARYMYEEGSIRIGLRNDAEIKKAIEVLSDTKKYDSILKG